MLSKEEIENSFTRIETTCKQEVCLFNQPIIEGNLNQIKRYIIQLETDKQKLIEKLAEDKKKANQIIKDGDYRYIQEVIDEAYERLKYANEILSILKGENDEH